MRVIIWGIGNYCNEKIDFIKDEIVAFVSRTKTAYKGFVSILPNEISMYDYDKLLILSYSYLDIIQDAIMLGVEYDKIVPGIAIYPPVFQEVEYMSRQWEKIEVQKDGSIFFQYSDGETIKVKNKKDLSLLKKKVCDENNAGIIKQMSCKPVGKLYGIDRGGSIVRYYIDDFLKKNMAHITGNVLEIGDNTYTVKFGKKYKSNILIYDDQITNENGIFHGDLQSGKGIKNNNYDCIILTQVLNFVDNITNTPEILVKGLKNNGVILMTISGITPICRYDMEQYGQYWSFTEKSIFNMFKNLNVDVEIYSYGNFKTACAFLAGISYKEIDTADMEYNDPDFPLTLS